MGKRYYCDYCCKTFKDTKEIKQNHIRGAQHKLIVKEHYQKYKEPEIIYNEEIKKLPCNRFLNDKTCSFSVNCHYSHYTPQELQQIYELSRLKITKNVYYKNYVENYLSLLNKKKLYKNNKKLQIFLRKYFHEHNSSESHISNLSQSLNNLDLEKVFADNTIEEWGNDFNKSNVNL